MNISKSLCVFLTGLSVLSLCSAEKIMMRNQFQKNAESWYVQPGWNGTLQWTPGTLVLKSVKKPNGNYGQCLKMIYVQRHLTGKMLKLRFTASGKGEVRIGGMIIPDHPGRPYVKWFGKSALTAKAVVIEQKIDLSLIQTDYLALILRVNADAEMKFSNVELLEKKDDKVVISVPEKPVAREKISSLSAKVSIPSEKYAVVCGSSAQFLSADKNGVLNIDGKLLPLRADGCAKFTVAARGTAASSAVTVVSPDEYDKNLKAAEKIGKKSLKIVWFGDSELDFDRANNTAAMVRYYLNCSGIKAASSHNFAVAGDTIIRAEARLAKRNVHRKEAYDNVRKVQADLVFVMFGHNDTVCWSSDNFSRAQITPNQQLDSGRRLLRMIRTIYPKARLILISPLALDNQFLRRQAEQRSKKSKTRTPCFGNPVLMQEFCRNWAALSREFKAEYLDIYTPMSKVSNRIKFFKPADEVHLNALGHRWVTARIMEYLADHPQWPR